MRSTPRTRSKNSPFLLGVTEKTLDNGLHLAAKQLPLLVPNIRTSLGEPGAVHVLLTFSAGSIFETEQELGYTHLVEHVLAERLERLAPHLLIHAITSHARTDFHCTVTPGSVRQLIKFLSTCFDPIAKTELDRAKAPILREIVQQESAEDAAEIKFYRSLLGKKLSRSQLGTLEGIRNAAIEDVKAFHARHFYPANAQLFLAGNIPENTMALVENHLSPYPSPGGPLTPQFDRHTKLKKEKGDRYISHQQAAYLLRDDGESDAVIRIVMNAPNTSHKGYYAALLSGTLLQHRLFKRLRADGRIYSLTVEYRMTGNRGYYEIDGRLRAADLEDGIADIFSTMDKMKKKITRKELALVKEQYFLDLNRHLSDFAGQLNYLQLWVQHRISPEDIMEWLLRIEPQEVQRIAQTFFPSRYADPSYRMIIRTCKSEW